MHIASSEVETKICSPFLPDMSFYKCEMPLKTFGLNLLELYFFYGDALFYQEVPGPRRQKGVIGDWGEDGNILVVDPATGTKTKEFVVWVIRISEVLNNAGQKRITWIGGKLIKKLFCNCSYLNMICY